MNESLSPSALTVIAAYNKEARPEPHHQCEAIAAALLAVADQVVPEQGCQIYGLTERENERQQVREEILAIAAELEGTNG